MAAPLDDEAVEAGVGPQRQLHQGRVQAEYKHNANKSSVADMGHGFVRTGKKLIHINKTI